MVYQCTVFADKLLTLKAVELATLSLMFLAGGCWSFLCRKLNECPLPHLRNQNCLVAFKYLQFLVNLDTAGADKPTSVAERSSLCFRAALAGNLVAFSFFQDLAYFDQSIDEEHSGEGFGVIACHSNNTSTLGTLHLLVHLLSQ